MWSCDGTREGLGNESGARGRRGGAQGLPSPPPRAAAAQSTMRAMCSWHSGAGLGAGVWWERIQTPPQPVWGQATVMPWADARCFPGHALSPYTGSLGHNPRFIAANSPFLFFSVFFIVVKYTNMELIIFKCTFSDINSIGNTV